MIELYRKIKDTREDLDIKEYEFAKMLNINYKTYNLYETGSRNMSLKVLDSIAIKLNVSIDYLFGKTKEKRYDKSRRMNYHTLLNNIKKIRKENKDTLYSLSEKLGITPQALNNYELGIRPLPVNILYKISCIYNVSADMLLGKVKKVESKVIL